MTRYVPVLLSLGAFLCAVVPAQQKDLRFQPNIPKTWDEKALSDWATPVAGLNVRPGHYSEAEYYKAPLDNYRTYPVYPPDREPAGYWDMLQKVGPKPLIEPEKLGTEADWLDAGKRVFDEFDFITLRSYDPKVIATIRSLPNAGAISGFRWVPTEKGLAIGQSSCASCHSRRQADGTQIPGLPTLSPTRAAPSAGAAGRIRLLGGSDHHIAGSPVRLLEPPGLRSYRAYGVPWVKGDIHEGLKQMSPEDVEALRRNATAVGNGIFARWNGSNYFPSKILDLVGIKDRKYLDSTATHLNRGIGDLMRYAALVGFAESSDFGPHHMLTAEQKKIPGRLPDEALYAMSLYIQSLQPPLNPYPFDERAAAGEKVFEREGCGGCHTPGFYTNNKLTLATGFRPPADKPATLDVVPISVGTDPSLALKTRKGTGYYKVPSLRGVWYRGRYLHEGSLASLEEMFDSDRLKETHVPGGWRPVGVETRAVVGHEFGLKLPPEEKGALLAFLRTL